MKLTVTHCYVHKIGNQTFTLIPNQFYKNHQRSKAKPLWLNRSGTITHVVFVNFHLKKVNWPLDWESTRINTNLCCMKLVETGVSVLEYNKYRPTHIELRNSQSVLQPELSSWLISWSAISKLTFILFILLSSWLDLFFSSACRCWQQITYLA